MPPTSTPIDFANATLSHYCGFYATVLDDVFTQEECHELVKLASASGPWTPAGLSAEGPTQTVHSNFRNSDRVLYIDAKVSDRLFKRLRSLVEDDIGEIAVGGKWEGITGKKGRHCARRIDWIST